MKEDKPQYISADKIYYYIEQQKSLPVGQGSKPIFTDSIVENYISHRIVSHIINGHRNAKLCTKPDPEPNKMKNPRQSCWRGSWVQGHAPGGGDGEIRTHEPV